MKSINLILPALTLIIISGCAIYKPISLDTSSRTQLTEAKIDIEVIGEPSLNSNLGGAVLFGALGQAVKGDSLQDSLKLEDPSKYIAVGLKKHLVKKYNVSSGTTFKLKLETEYFWLGDPIGDGADTLAIGLIIDMKLIAPNTKVIAQGVCNKGISMNDKNGLYLLDKDLKPENFHLVRKAVEQSSQKCVDLFNALL